MKKHTGKIELYEDMSGRYRWRMKSANGRIVADSAEAYETKSGVRAAARRARRLFRSVWLNPAVRWRTSG